MWSVSCPRQLGGFVFPEFWQFTGLFSSLCWALAGPILLEIMFFTFGNSSWMILISLPCAFCAVRVLSLRTGHRSSFSPIFYGFVILPHFLDNFLNFISSSLSLLFLLSKFYCYEIFLVLGMSLLIVSCSYTITALSSLTSLQDVSDRLPVRMAV